MASLKFTGVPPFSYLRIFLRTSPTIWSSGLKRQKRYAAACLSAIILAGCASAPPSMSTVEQQTFRNRLASDAVTITVLRDKKLVDWGSGLLLGNDRVLTASHVIDSAANGDEIIVTHGIWREKSHVVAPGDRIRNDAAILALNAPLEGRPGAPPPLCRTSSQSGAALVVVTPSGPIQTYALPPVEGMPVPAGAVAASTFFKPGASGYAVVDLQQRCIAGVLSQGKNIATAAGVEGAGRIKWSDLTTILTDAVEDRQFC